MIARVSFLVIALTVGVVAASLLPGLSQSVRKAVGLASEPSAAQSRGDTVNGAKPSSEPADEKPSIKLTEEQIAAAKIDLVAAQGGILARRLTVPGTVVPRADRIARVAVKLSGTVAELRKNLGDPVVKDEVVAVLESREVADAKSEYLAAQLTKELQQALFQRDKKLWEGRVLTEQQFLRSSNLTAQTEMKFNIARQKLFALGLGEREIADLAPGAGSLLAPAGSALADDRPGRRAQGRSRDGGGTRQPRDGAVRDPRSRPRVGRSSGQSGRPSSHQGRPNRGHHDPRNQGQG